MTEHAPSLQDPARRRLVGAVPAAAIAAMMGANSSKAGQLPPVGTGWREALLVVADSKPWIETLTGLGGVGDRVGRRLRWRS